MYYIVSKQYLDKNKSFEGFNVIKVCKNIGSAVYIVANDVGIDDPYSITMKLDGPISDRLIVDSVDEDSIYIIDCLDEEE